MGAIIIFGLIGLTIGLIVDSGKNDWVGTAENQMCPRCGKKLTMYGPYSYKRDHVVYNYHCTRLNEETNRSCYFRLAAKSPRALVKAFDAHTGKTSKVIPLWRGKVMKDLFIPFDGKLKTMESLDGTHSRLWITKYKVIYGWLDLDERAEIHNKGMVFETGIDEFVHTLLAYSVDSEDIAEIIKDDLEPLDSFDNINCPDPDCDGDVAKFYSTNGSVAFVCGECGLSGPTVEFESDLASIKKAKAAFDRVFNIKQSIKSGWEWK